MAIPSVRNDLEISPRSGSQGGILVYDPKNEVGHALGPVASALFAACDGNLERGDLASVVAVATGESNTALNEELGELALDELARAGLLSAPLEPRSPEMSRRKLLAGMAIGVAGIAALPLLESITKAQSASALPAMTVDDITATCIKDSTAAITLTQQNASSPEDVVYWIYTQPLHGTVSIIGSTATYTPDAGYTGPDSFSYTGGVCVPAPGGFYAPPSLICPEGEVVFTGADPATVSITVSEPPAPTTTATSEPTAPTFTG